MSFYDDMAQLALDLLTQFGQPLTLKRILADSRDPVTGVYTPGLQDDQTTTGVVTEYPNHLINGTSIQVGDRQVILSGEVEPLLTDHVLLDGEELPIVRVEQVNPAGTPIIYKVQIRA